MSRPEDNYNEWLTRQSAAERASLPAAPTHAQAQARARSAPQAVPQGERALLLAFCDFFDPQHLDSKLTEETVDAFLAHLRDLRRAAEKANTCPKCGKLLTADTRDGSILCWCPEDE